MVSDAYIQYLQRGGQKPVLHLLPVSRLQKKKRSICHWKIIFKKLSLWGKASWHFPLPFQGERRLMVSTFQPSEGALLAQNACNCQNSKMTFPPPQPLVIHIVYNLPVSVGATCKYNGICLPWWCSFYYKRDFFFHSSLGLVEFIKCKIILDGPCLRR